jgi:hypothetical protein
MGGTGRARFDGGDRGHVREPGISRLTDLHRAVVDELGGNQAGPGGDHDHRCGAAGGYHPAGGGCRSHQQRADPADPALQRGDCSEDEPQ